MSRAIPSSTSSAKAFVPIPTLPLVRTVLLGINLIGSLTFLAELWFLGHFKEPLQYVAISAAILGVLGTLVSISQRPAARVIAGLIALGMMGAGSIGLIVHISRNLKYADTPSLWAALTGPLPVLAPLSLANVGLLLLVAAWLGWSQSRVNA